MNEVDMFVCIIEINSEFIYKDEFHITRSFFYIELRKETHTN